MKPGGLEHPKKPLVYLIPAPLHEDTLDPVPPAAREAVGQCEVFFVENLRTARRYLRRLWKDMEIDAYAWVPIHKAEQEALAAFADHLEKGRTIGILSEAGCPGIADPGQALVALAQQKGVEIRPVAGPNAMILALMASGLNGQQFRFSGYLPVDDRARSRALRALEEDSMRTGCTQIFMETPYRNNQLLDALLRHCNPGTLLCIAADLTGPAQYVRTKTIAAWKKEKPDLHKRPAIFCILHPGQRPGPAQFQAVLT